MNQYSLYVQNDKYQKLCILKINVSYNGQSSQKRSFVCQKSDLIGIMMHQT